VFAQAQASASGSRHTYGPTLGAGSKAKIADIMSTVADRKPATINLDIFKEKVPQPNYRPANYSALTETFQRAFGQADKDKQISSGGTWSINDMVKALQGSITAIANPAAPELQNATAAPDANATAAAKPFDEYAGGLFCGEGIKLANCSGVNPCWGHKCMVGSMCVVNMCGEKCSPKCVSYAEIGAGVNKVLNSIGLSSA
jgi:hypothetical protein